MKKPASLKRDAGDMQYFLRDEAENKPFSVTGTVRNP